MRIYKYSNIFFGTIILYLSIYRLYICKSIVKANRLCGLVVRVSGYRYRGLGFDSRHYQIF